VVLGIFFIFDYAVNWGIVGNDLSDYECTCTGRRGRTTGMQKQETRRNAKASRSKPRKTKTAQQIAPLQRLFGGRGEREGSG
jgi:hypothetical protein